jgi:hypothetical protein
MLRSIGVVVVVGANGIFSEDIRVFYPLIVLQSVTLLLDHVPEATVADPCLEDLSDLPPLISVCLEDGQQLIVPRGLGNGSSFASSIFTTGKTGWS